MLFPGQQRRRLGEERHVPESEHWWGEWATTGLLVRPLKFLRGDDAKIWSYPDNGDKGDNSWYVGFFGFLVLLLGISSFSKWDTLMTLVVSVTDKEYGLLPYTKEEGHGISGINGWLGGYLVSQLLWKSRNWHCVRGLAVVQSYVAQWMKDSAVSHECHFETLGAGFMAGLALRNLGPKPNPVRVFANWSGVIVAVVMTIYVFLMTTVETILD